MHGNKKVLTNAWVEVGLLFSIPSVMREIQNIEIKHLKSWSELCGMNRQAAAKRGGRGYTYYLLSQTKV